MTTTEEVIKKSSLEFLRKLYEFGGEDVNRQEILDELEIENGSKLESDVMDYLENENLMKTVLGGSIVMITDHGIKMIKNL